MTINISESNGIITAVLSGRLDTAAAPQFNIDMQPLLNNADKHIILDCADMSFISSSGLRLFLTLRKATMAKDGDVTIRNVSDNIKQVFTLTGFYNLFNFE